MPTVFIALGSNLGNRDKNIEEAKRLMQVNKITVLKSSTTIETEPVGGPKQGKYLNAVIKAKTDLKPRELLRTLLAIEDKLGRVRSVKDGPRTIDLDILLYDRMKIETADLTIPHPRMLKRDFVLIPLNEIEPNWHAFLP